MRRLWAKLNVDFVTVHEDPSGARKKVELKVASAIFCSPFPSCLSQNTPAPVPLSSSPV